MKTGDRVTCIDGDLPTITKGNVYTILGLKSCLEIIQTEIEGGEKVIKWEKEKIERKKKEIEEISSQINSSAPKVGDIYTSKYPGPYRGDKYLVVEIQDQGFCLVNTSGVKNNGRGGLWSQPTKNIEDIFAGYSKYDFIKE